MPIRCACCGQRALARRTRPGHDLYVKSHFAADATLCPCHDAGDDIEFVP
jgi:hypothetical protein